jgi:hypothetical protein
VDPRVTGAVQRTMTIAAESVANEDESDLLRERLHNFGNSSEPFASCVRLQFNRPTKGVNLLTHEVAMTVSRSKPNTESESCFGVACEKANPTPAYPLRL